MAKIYDVDYFIGKFEAIPGSKFTKYTQIDSFGNRCALGWCDLRDGINYVNINGAETREGIALKKLFFDAEIFYPAMGRCQGVAAVNNGHHPKYKQRTPKQRILAALYDIKKLQEGIKIEPVVIEKSIEDDNICDYEEEGLFEPEEKLNQGTGTSTERRNEVQSELPKPTPKIDIQFPEYHKPVEETLERGMVETVL